MGRAAFAAAGLGILAGCESGPGSTRLAGPYPTPTIIAVAPALNFSGSRQFDPDQVADLMASELTHVDDVHVIGVNRVLAVLKDEGRVEIVSPAHALSVSERLGADGILVFAITEYDPYEPPVVGLAAQLYAASEPPLVRRTRSATTGPAAPFEAPPATESSLRPRAQFQRVFNAAHEIVAEDVRRFAKTPSRIARRIRAPTAGASTWSVRCSSCGIAVMRLFAS